MTTKEHLEKHDRQIAAIRDLVQQGMRSVLETRKDIRALTVAQRRTDASLRAFIDSLKGGGDDHATEKIDPR